MTELNRKYQIRNLEDIVEELQKQVHTLANAVRELAIEVKVNRNFIEKGAKLSKKTIEAIQFVSDNVKAEHRPTQHDKNGYSKPYELSQSQVDALKAKGWMGDNFKKK